MVRYSASANDVLTVGCLRFFQETGEFPSWTKYPVTDMRIRGHDVQSKSHQSVI